MNHYHLNLGNACNQNCEFCLVNGGKGHLISFESALSKLRTARRKGAIYLSIDGGEPTIAPYFSELVESSFLLGFKTIAIKTNGIGFSQNSIAQQILKTHKNDIIIYVSLHGPSAQIHNELAQNKESFRRAVKAIENIRKLGGRVICNLVVCSSNVEHLTQYIDLLSKLHVQETIFLFIIPKGRALYNNFLVPEIGSTVPFVGEAIEHAKALKITVSLTFYPFCILGKYKDNAVEYHMKTNLKHFDQLYKHKYSNAVCKVCLYNRNCPKIWKDYLKIYPFTFNPIK